MDKPVTVTEETLAKINAYAVKPLTAEEVYCFGVLLCDNEIDRDGEKFTVPALTKLSELFVGRTGIFDHDPRTGNQNARIYETRVVPHPDRLTADGEEYTALMGWAYMVRTEDNRSLIAEIDGGIKKEVSVSCSVGKKRCSVCGSDRLTRPCAHKRGKSYGDKLCYDLLEEPTDAYEWSFVAVPAQRGAGVTKSFSDGGDELQRLRQEQREVRADMVSELIRLSPFAGRSPGELKARAESLDWKGLKALRDDLRRAARTGAEGPAPAADNADFMFR